MVILLLLILTVPIIAQDSTSVYDPCYDSQLIRLESRDSLTESESILYLELRKLCDNKNDDNVDGAAKQKSKTEDISELQRERNDNYRDSREAALSAMTVYYVISIIGLLISLVYLLSI